MIFIWNRKKVYDGTSIKEFNNFRDILSSHNIKYKYRVVNRNNSSIMDTNRIRTGTLGENQNLAYRYYLYVHKDFYDEACFILRSLK